jgi:hypothetical protein
MGNPYLLIMSIAGMFILSFFFNIVAKKTNFPSVLLLIGLGMGLKALLDSNGLSKDLSMDTLLEVFANIGLVMIILEASLNVRLEKEKSKLILQSLLISVVGLGVTVSGLTVFFLYIFPSSDVYTAICYSIPFGLLSNSIMFPSVGGLTGKKKEFMKYESSFTNIIGIIVFYFMIGAEGNSGGHVTSDILLNLVLAVALSVVVAYCLIFLFHRLQLQVKLLLLLAILVLLFAVGKYYQLSSLLLILAFGLLLNNTDVFFRGRLAKLFDTEKVKPILRDFQQLTLETAFFIRTIFFVFLGLSITLSSLYDWRVVINSLVIVAILYLVRFIVLRFIAREQLFPGMLIAPRGLITVILFFILALDDTQNIPAFIPGLLLYPILITSIIATISMILHRGENVKDVLFHKLPMISTNGDEALDQRIDENTEKQHFNGF